MLHSFDHQSVVNDRLCSIEYELIYHRFWSVGGRCSPFFLFSHQTGSGGGAYLWVCIQGKGYNYTLDNSPYLVTFLDT